MDFVLGWLDEALTTFLPADAKARGGTLAALRAQREKLRRDPIKAMRFAIDALHKLPPPAAGEDRDLAAFRAELREINVFHNGSLRCRHGQRPQNGVFNHVLHIFIRLARSVAPRKQYEVNINVVALFKGNILFQQRKLSQI